MQQTLLKIINHKKTSFMKKIKNLLISRMWGSLMFLCYSLVLTKLKKKGHPIFWFPQKNLETWQRFHTTLSTVNIEIEIE